MHDSCVWGAGCVDRGEAGTRLRASVVGVAVVVVWSVGLALLAAALTVAESSVQEGASPAHVIKAASCSQQDVQQANDAAKDGDAVLVPAGEATWTPPDARTPSVLLGGRTILLEGAGAGKTIITDGPPHPWKSLALVVQNAGKPAPGRVDLAARGESHVLS